MRNRQRGAAIVEFALVLPFLLMLALLVTEFGRAVYRYNGVVKAVRDGVRYLAVQPPGDSTAIATARNLVVYGNVAGSGAPLDPNLDAGMVSASWSNYGTAPSVKVVTLSVSGYTFQPLITAYFGEHFSTIVFSDISASMRSPS